MLLITLAQSNPDGWASAIITGLGGTGIGGLIAWYMLTKWSPKVEENHGKQLLEQRADLLALCQKERELASAVVKIFADAQQVTVKDNNDSLGELHRKVDEVLQELKNNTTLQDEYARTRRLLDEWEKKHGSKTRIKDANNPPT